MYVRVRYCHKVDLNKVAKMINKDVSSPNYGRSEVSPNLGNEARLTFDQLICGRTLTMGVVGVFRNR